MDHHPQLLVPSDRIAADDSCAVAERPADVPLANSRHAVLWHVHRPFHEPALLALALGLRRTGGSLADRLRHTGAGHCPRGKGRRRPDGGRIPGADHRAALQDRLRLHEVGTGHLPAHRGLPPLPGLHGWALRGARRHAGGSPAGRSHCAFCLSPLSFH